MTVPDIYNLSDIKWMVKSRQLANWDDSWAWTFAYDMKGELIPVVGALVDDLRENPNGYIDVPPFRISMQKDKFLSRRKIE